MTTTSTVSSIDLPSRRADVLRCALTGAISAPAFFILCWLGAFLPVGPATHAYLSLFTNAEITSVTALLEGTLWSLAFGLVLGAIVALAYRATASFGRG